MNDAQHIERVLQDAVDESDFDCIALSGGLDSTILAHLASSKNPLALAVAADGFDASDLEFSKLAAKNCNLNLKLLRPDADELADAARKTADILGNFNDIEIRNATVMYVLLSNAKKLGMHKVMTGDGADELFAGYKFMRKLNPEKLQSELDRVYSVMHFTSQIIAKDMGIQHSLTVSGAIENVIQAAKSIAPDYTKSDARENALAVQLALDLIFSYAFESSTYITVALRISMSLKLQSIFLAARQAHQSGLSFRSDCSFLQPVWRIPNP